MLHINNRIGDYLLNVGRNDPSKRKLLAPWIPQIRTFSIPITSCDQISVFPFYVQDEVEDALDYLSRAPIELEPSVYHVQKPQPPVQTDSKLERLAQQLPAELRVRIFGNAMECSACGKRMYDFSSDDLPQIRWLSIRNTKFCGWGCRMTHMLRQQREHYDPDNLVDSLRNYEIKSMYENEACICRPGDYCRHRGYY